MDEPSLQDLVQELRTLRIREAQILDRIEVIATKTPAEEKEQPPASSAEAATPGFKIGDRIVIQNKVKKPANWSDQHPWLESEHRVATIRDIIRLGPTNIQIHFITDGGIETWRAPNNVSLLR